MTFFERSLRKYNNLSHNRVFEDMRNEVVDFHSITLGPFSSQPKDFKIVISCMEKDTTQVSKIFDYKDKNNSILHSVK